MRRELLVRAAVAAVSVLLVTASGAAAATDVRVVRDDQYLTGADGLDGTYIYSRVPFHKGTLKHPWIRVFDGRRHNANLPRQGVVRAQGLGRDRHGRLVMPYMTGRRTKTKLVDRRWWLYDIRRDRSRALKGLPSGDCTPDRLTLWRTWLAFERDGACTPGTFLRRNGRNRRISRLTISDESAPPLVMRGRTLAMIAGGGDGDFEVWQLVVDGRVCPRPVPQSRGAGDSDFTPYALWLNGDRLSWAMDESLVLETTLHRDCSQAGLPAAYADLAHPPIAVDATSISTTDRRSIFRRDVPDGPSSAPPANASVATAQVLPGSVPQKLTARIGTATPAPGDPPVHSSAHPEHQATRVLWYAFRPDAAQQVTVSGDSHEYASSWATFGAATVYEDAGDGVLTELPAHRDTFDQNATTFDADPAHRYLIGFGCDEAEPCWESFSLRIDPGTQAGG